MAGQHTTWRPFLAFVFAIVLLVCPALTVDRNKFKTCAQSGFCKRNRDYADTAASHGSSWNSPYDLDPGSISFNNGALSGIIRKTVNATSGDTVRLPLSVAFLESGAARVTVDEEKRVKGDIELRHESKASKGRCNIAEKWAIVGGLTKSKGATLDQTSKSGTTRVTFGQDGAHEALVRHAPFEIVFMRNGEKQIVLNGQGLMNVEHWRPKIEKEVKEGEEGEAVQEKSEDESTWWEESFGGHSDSKPRGPESVAMDVTFPGYEHVYGIPEHSGPMSLRQTRGGGDGTFEDPYRMYNSDVFEYEIDSPMTLYGTIPFMQAQKKDSTVGVFWLNSAETWVDIVKSKQSSNPLSMGVSKTDTRTHWISESGLLDVFVLLGPTPQSMSKIYGGLTGYTQLPQLFAVGYHQCRWNYVTDEDVRNVDRKFDRHNIPYDVIWLDLDYLDDKKFFTWDPLTFGDPEGMQKQLDEHDRKLVGLIDPHVKRLDGYDVYEELKSKDLAVKNKETSGMWEGHCWPGASHWIDCFNPAVRPWWKSLFRYDRFKGSMHNMFVWNDMNEPSVFNGVEMTMPKDLIHHGNWEHRDVHNVNGMTFHNATFHALETRDDPKGKTPTKRPFALTRSFYAGSQRLGAHWTGDNQALWSHLKGSLPMVLNNGVSGFPFSGADVGGFMGNPSPELQVRWFQAGAFYPFFRAHSHIDTRRREPYLLEEPHKEYSAQAIRLRYSLLPSWYTAFHEASTDGIPIIRPMWWVHPNDETGFGLDDQFYLGDTGLLAKPVTEEGSTSVNIHLPPSTAENNAPVPYYDYNDYTTYRSGTTTSKSHTVSAPLEKVPLLMRSGHIFARRDRPRRSAGLMRNDPFTLVVVLDPSNPQTSAEGSLYFDDGESYAYEKGARVHRRFTFAEDALESIDVDVAPTAKDSSFEKTKEQYLKSIEGLALEKIVIVGAPKQWRNKDKVSVSLEGGAGGDTRGKASSREAVADAEMRFVENGKGKADYAVVKRPGVAIGRGWKIVF